MSATTIKKCKPMSDEDIREYLLNNGQWLEGWISQKVIDDVRKHLKAPKK